MIKVRLMTKNHIYKYETLMDGFTKILLKDNVPGLYKGLVAFSLTYMGQYSIQMVLYEMYLDLKKKSMGLKTYKENENRSVVEASVVSSVFTSVFTNALEVVVIRKQAESGESTMQIFK